MSIEKAYDIWAHQYDTNKNRTRDLDKRSTIETLSNYNFENVLELGCGTGKNTVWLLSKAKQVVGLDFSREMLNKAKEKISDKRVVFKKTDLKSLKPEYIQTYNKVMSVLYMWIKSNGNEFLNNVNYLQSSNY